MEYEVGNNDHKCTLTCTQNKLDYMYCMEGNFGGGKCWQIWRMTVDSSNLFQPNFIQLKKVLRDKIHVGIHQCRF